jgi:DUF4097 and DUF4098 domain-containing protein YvlB
MRRGSLVGPLILILIGGLFLMNNLRPELPLLEILANYWPFLLIGWGALRLLEIFYWLIRGQSLPSAGISGGEWVLIVFLSLVGSGLYAARRYTSDWPSSRIMMRGVEVFGATFDFPVAEQKQPAGKAPRVVIESVRGNVRLIGTDAQEVKINGRKTVRAFHQSDADDADRKSPVELTNQGDRVTIRSIQDRIGRDQRLSVDLEVAVPRGASIEARGRYGDFDISDIQGTVDIDSENAGVRLQNIGNNVRVDLRRSDIVRATNIKGTLDLKGRGQDIEFENIEGQVTVNGGYSGEIQFRKLAKPVHFEGTQTELRVERIPGQVRLALGDLTASDLVGPIRLTARSRDVHLSNFRESVEISLDRGDIELRPMRTPLSKMEVETRAGNVELALPAGARFDLKATTRRGEVQNDYGAPLRGESGGEGKNRGESLTGAVGPGPEVRILTHRGRVVVRKGSAELELERPPAPPAAKSELTPKDQ